MEINDKNNQKKLKEDFYEYLGIIKEIIVFCKSPISRPADVNISYNEIKHHFINITNLFAKMDKELKNKVWWDYFSIRGKILNLGSKIIVRSDYQKDSSDYEKYICFENRLQFTNKIMKYDIDNLEENITKENYTKENNTKENNTKENNTKENDAKENITKENITKENNAKENNTKENNTKENDAKENITKENITKENNAKENITKENNTKENNTKESDAKENITKENITNESKQPEDFESITKHIEKLISEQNITTKKIYCYNSNIPILLKHYGYIKDEIIQYQSKLNNLIDKINR
jgi:flagellar biosynthesis GTPase FlhF